MNYPQYGIVDGNEKHLFAVDSETGEISSVGFLMPESPNFVSIILSFQYSFIGLVWGEQWPSSMND